MPNPTDEGRIGDKTKNQTVVDLAEYRANAGSKSISTKYLDPVMLAKIAPLVIAALLVWWFVFGRR